MMDMEMVKNMLLLGSYDLVIKSREKTTKIEVDASMKASGANINENVKDSHRHDDMIVGNKGTNKTHVNASVTQ